MMIPVLLIGIASLFSGLGMMEDLWKNRRRERASSWILPISFIIGGFVAIVYGVNYWIVYWLNPQS